MYCWSINSYILVSALRTVATATVGMTMYGSATPAHETNQMVLAEYHAQSLLHCAALCRHENCQALLYVDVDTSSDDCFSSTNTQDFSGRKNVTASGRTCQRWDTNDPHSSTIYNANNMPDSSLTDAQNYCRNPDNEPGIWCYTIDPNIRWEYCDIWRCLPPDVNCRLYNTAGVGVRTTQDKYNFYTVQ